MREEEALSSSMLAHEEVARQMAAPLEINEHRLLNASPRRFLQLRYNQIRFLRNSNKAREET